VCASSVILRPIQVIAAPFAGTPLAMATRKERRMAGSGARFVAIGAPLLIIGIVLALVLDGTARGIGAAIAVLGSIPCVVGATLLLSAGTEKRSREGKPYS
jgi:hypothetical protein